MPKFSLKTVVFFVTVGCVLLALSQSRSVVFVLLAGLTGLGIVLLTVVVAWQIVVETIKPFRRPPKRKTLDDSSFVVSGAAGAALNRHAAKSRIDGHQSKQKLLLILILFVGVLVTPVFVRFYRFRQQKLKRSDWVSTVIMFDEVLSENVTSEDVVKVLLSSTAVGVGLLMVVVAWHIVMETIKPLRRRPLRNRLDDPYSVVNAGDSAAMAHPREKPSANSRRSKYIVLSLLVLFLVVLVTPVFVRLNRFRQQRAKIPIPISGIVTLNDFPLVNAKVVFHPANGGTLRSTRTNWSGQFQITLKAGRHLITVTQDEGTNGRRLIPEDVNSRETTPFSFDASHSGPSIADIHLEN